MSEFFATSEINGMKTSQRGQEKMLYSAEAIKKICLEAGADDAGLVEIDRGSLEKEREGILQVYSLARSVLSIIVTVEAGLGHMGLNRLVLHPKFGSAIQLDSILINGVVDQYDQPLTENPCFHCNLCAVVCPTGAITKEQPFDFVACITHTYRDVERILKPLRDRQEPVYVMAGSKAEARVKKNPRSRQHNTVMLLVGNSNMNSGV